ncbi:ADP-ribosylation factor-like protein 11 [Clytia hemisphaerica]|uniref:AdoMet activation domain-containing protein n=1 Tax=Clytia hemisphaerica TaxID=252671 RepID=A0A7M5UA62_9CNID
MTLTMEWFKTLKPAHKTLIVTGAGISVALLSYSIYRHKNSRKVDEDDVRDEGSTSPVPVREASSWLKDNIGCDTPEDVGVRSMHVIETPKDEVNPEGWVTPTPSNGNLVCREVQNTESESFEGTPRELSPRQPVESESTMDEDVEVDRKASRKILILGLEQAGKSALLSQLSKEGTDCSNYLPTKGFNVVCISFDTIDLNIWEVGGALEYRSYWKNFSQSTDLILFAVDASDRTKFPAAKLYFNDIIGEANENSDFHIIATKSDLEGAAKADEIQHALGLDGMKINVVEVAVRTGGASQNIGLEEVQKRCLNEEDDVHL